MKFTVFLLTIVLSQVQRVASKGWNAGYKDEYLYSMGWGCYLKRLSLITFMLSGVILYYVPESRFYFRRGCHGVIDFVADGLKAALNVTDAEYTTDDSSSDYSEQESATTVGKKTLSLANQVKIHNDHGYIGNYKKSITSSLDETIEKGITRTKKNLRYSSNTRGSEDNFNQRRYRQQRENFGKFGKFSTTENSSSLPCETFQLYPEKIPNFEKFSKSKYLCNSDRDSDSSDAICVSLNDKNSRQNVYPENVARDNEEFIIIEESEPTIYPEDESIYDRLEKETGKNYRHCEDEDLTNSKNRWKLERQLFEFDKTLRDFRSLLAGKYSAKGGTNEGYARHFIEAILQSLERRFGEIEESRKNSTRKWCRKPRENGDTSMTRRAKKLVSVDNKNRQLAIRLSKLDNTCPDYRSSSSMRKKLRPNYPSNICEASLARKRYNSFSVLPKETVDVSIITNRVKPMLDRAVRWFYGSCPGMTNNATVVGNVDICENNECTKISDLWLL